MRRYHYNKDAIVNCLKALGVNKGDTLFSHVSLLSLGFCQTEPAQTLITAVKEVIGESGTFLTPSFTYSFCQNETFNPETSKSQVGGFSNYLLDELNTPRSLDPIFSVTGFGKNIDKLFNDLPPSSFGKNCLYERLERIDTKICNIGLSLFYLTPIHYLENTLNVPYRYNKNFTGTIELQGQHQEVTWEYYVRHLCDASMPNCTPLQEEGETRGICKKHTLGLGSVYLADMKTYFALAKEMIEQDPWFLASGNSL